MENFFSGLGSILVVCKPSDNSSDAVPSYTKREPLNDTGNRGSPEIPLVRQGKETLVFSSYQTLSTDRS